MNEAKYEELIRKYGIVTSYNYYGILASYNSFESPAPYDEEKDRWTFRPVEKTKSIPLQINSETSIPLEMMKNKKARQGFWLKFFSQKA